MSVTREIDEGDPQFSGPLRSLGVDVRRGKERRVRQAAREIRHRPESLGPQGRPGEPREAHRRRPVSDHLDNIRPPRLALRPPTETEAKAGQPLAGFERTLEKRSISTDSIPTVRPHGSAPALCSDIESVHNF